MCTCNNPCSNCGYQVVTCHYCGEEAILEGWLTNGSPLLVYGSVCSKHASNLKGWQGTLAKTLEKAESLTE